MILLLVAMAMAVPVAMQMVAVPLRYQCTLLPMRPKRHQHDWWRRVILLCREVRVDVQDVPAQGASGVLLHPGVHAVHVKLMAAGEPAQQIASLKVAQADL